MNVQKAKNKASKRRRKVDANAIDPFEQGRVALQALRELVGYNVELVDELKALFRSLDAGKSLDISGIPDAYVKNQVALIFKKCSLLRRKDKYTYQSRDKPGRGSVMALLEPVMDEPRAELELAYREAQNRRLGEGDDRSGAGDDAGVVARSGEPDATTTEVKKPRRAGPAMPTAEERMQAQSMMEAHLVTNEEGMEDAGRGIDAVGPALPEFVFEELAMSSDPKTAAVGRIMHVLGEHRARGLRGKDAKSYDPNPYVVLDVSENASPGEVNKAFKKLSLLLHPDKNDHPCAATAFEAASSASKRLQDVALRAVVHQELEEIKDIEALNAAVSREERARQWRIAKGEALETSHMPASRQEWMTKVPEKGDPLANIDLGASRSFSVRPCAGPSARPVGPSAGVSPAFEQQVRPSLMEQHAQRSKGSKQEQQRGARLPFDRERDLERPRSAGNVAELIKGTRSLDDRFR